jgi:hypothetical protein
MKIKRLPRGLIVISVLLFSLPLITVHGAGGKIEGKITNPKGAIVVGAAVTVTETDTNQITAVRQAGPVQDRRIAARNLHGDRFGAGLQRSTARGH